MTKSLRKAIMLRSQLKKKFNNNKSEENSEKYKQQRNYCAKLLRKTKMEYFQNKLMTICNVNSQSILQVSAKPTVLKMLYWLWLKNRKLFWIKKLKVGTLFMDLSKTCNILDHSLLSAKLSVYGFDNNSLSFIRSYLTSRIQRCTIENHFSNWREIRTGVRQWYFPIRWKFKRL